MSREEKKHRLLQLYDSDLRAADSILQSGRLHPLPDPQDDDDGAKTKAMTSTFLPGSTEELNYFSAPLPPFPEIRNTIGSAPIPRPAPFVMERSHTTLGAVEIGGNAVPSSPSGTRSHDKSARDEAQSSGAQSAQSARSVEYLTPESVPQTPPGFNTASIPRTIHAQPPVCAPKERPPLKAGKEVYYCDKTSTVIPAVPPIPPPPRTMERRRHSTAVPAMPAQMLQDIRNLPRRPKSAAAATRIHRDASVSSMRRSMSKEKSKWDPFQVLSSARHGKYEDVEIALSTGFGVNFADTHGNTIFHVACQNGRKRIAKLAVKYGADIDARNAKGNTGLHFLFAYGYPEIAEYFIGKGAREDIRNEAGKVAREGIR